MALFETGNPTLSQKIFDRSKALQASAEGVMSVRGTLNKFGFLLLMVIAGAGFTWHLYETYAQDTMMGLMITGLFGGLICALIMVFKPNWSPYLAPAYGILEGFVLGSISVLVNEAFKKTYPGIIIQAVGLTFGVALAMFLLYNFRIIRATEKFKRIVYTSIMGIAVFYLITFIVRLFGVNLDFMYNASPLGIGISLFIVAIASMRLIIHFDTIEKGAEEGAPKFMEWYCSFSLLVTLIWLYMEILKLLMRLSRRN